MPSRRGLTRTVIGRSPRRLTAWGDGPGGTTSTQVNSSATRILGSGVALTTEDRVTLVRLRGHLVANVASATAAGDGVVGAFGIALVTSDAFAVGVSAVPDPLTEAEFQWLYYTKVSWRVPAPSADIRDGYDRTIVIDNKAMRKWRDGMTMVGILETVLIGTADVRVDFDTRLLVKLS